MQRPDAAKLPICGRCHLDHIWQSDDDCLRRLRQAIAAAGGDPKKRRDGRSLAGESADGRVGNQGR